MTATEQVDALIIGGGFYGCRLALHMKRRHGLARVTVAERGEELLGRASYVNQARVHNGYHYPRSFTTAYRSRLNLPRFLDEFADCVETDFIKLYAIARRNSQVTSRQFERFCREIGAKLYTPWQEHLKLFDKRLIEGVFLVEEYAFDAARLRARMAAALEQAAIDVRLGRHVSALRTGNEGVDATIVGPDDEIRTLQARHVFNCTYAGLNAFGGLRSGLKYEITELALIEPPPALRDIGLTVMDGPFFSCMPFPAAGLHSLSHVRYTPHVSWTSRDAGDVDPDTVLARYAKVSRVGHMIRDAARYVPAIVEARHQRSLFDVKVVLTSNESDDGRPILFTEHSASRGMHHVLGGKIDNIYDIEAAVDDAMRAPARPEKASALEEANA